MSKASKDRSKNLSCMSKLFIIVVAGARCSRYARIYRESDRGVERL